MGLPDDFIDGGDFKFRDLWEHRPDKAVYIGALAKIDRCGEPAKKILRAYRPTVQSTATALIMNNHLDKAQLDHLLEDVAEHDQA